MILVDIDCVIQRTFDASALRSTNLICSQFPDFHSYVHHVKAACSNYTYTQQHNLQLPHSGSYFT
jgi:hypothetical protein